MPEKIDYNGFVGKHYETNHEVGLNADAIFKITAFVELHDFGTAGGKLPAFRVQRLNPPGMHTEACESFLNNHSEIEEPKAAA